MKSEHATRVIKTLTKTFSMFYIKIQRPWPNRRWAAQAGCPPTPTVQLFQFSHLGEAGLDFRDFFVGAVCAIQMIKSCPEAACTRLIHIPDASLSNFGKFTSPSSWVSAPCRTIQSSLVLLTKEYHCWHRIGSSLGLPTGCAVGLHA